MAEVDKELCEELYSGLVVNDASVVIFFMRVSVEKYEGKPPPLELARKGAV